MAAASTLHSLAQSYASGSSESSSEDSGNDIKIVELDNEKKRKSSENNSPSEKRTKSESKDDNKSNDEESTTKTTRELLPVPDGVLQMYKKQNEAEIKNDPANHDGRIRSFPHERGNWATYIYIPCYPGPFLWDLINTLIEIASPDIPFTPMDEFHISLSRTIILRHHWIDMFVDSLSEKVKDNSSSSFVCWFESIELYTNEEKTRTFLGLKIGADSGRLQSLTSHVDKCLKEFKLKTFYDNPSFHMSFAWIAGDVMSKMQPTTLKRMKEQFLKMQCLQASSLLVQVSEMHCKTGNKVYSFSLEKHSSLVI